MNGQQFVLVLNVSIEQRAPSGAYHGNGLRIQEERNLTLTSFLEVARVLGRFDELMDVISDESVAVQSAGSRGEASTTP